MLNYKFYFLIAIFSVVFGSAAFCQQAKSDTLRRDSLITDLKESVLDNIPIVSLDENDNLDGTTQNVSTQMNSGRDPFLKVALFNFNAVRFRLRGYDANLFDTYMNGAPMENLDNGFTPYGLWGGLNDVLHNKETIVGIRGGKMAFRNLGDKKYGIGNLGGYTNIDARAFRQRKGTQVGYAISNRNYTHRFSITHSSGFSKKGWAYSLSASRRYAGEGYVDGTYYNGWSYYAGVDKKINNNQLLSFVTFGTPTENGRQGASVQEMMNIAGTHYYNPYWGYQAGKKRNASVGKSFQPIGILTHDWRVNTKSNLTTAISYTTGYRSTTGLDWYNAADPRPDYYRYLPSYQDDPRQAELVDSMLRANVNLRQINWDRLYNVNYNNIETVHNANGIAGNDVTGKRSLYIVEERITHTDKYNFNSTFNTAVNSHIDLISGLRFEGQKNHYYKKVDDLLGGDFYVNINQFAERDFPGNPNAAQNDLDHPNRILKVGDKSGYDYNIDIQKISGWIQTDVKFKHIDFFVAMEHSYTRFWREGNVRNGLFPNNSLGRSKDIEFYNYNLKGGLTYKINKNHFIFANGSYMTRAPFFENAYISPRTREFTQDNLQSEQISSVEGGYLLNTPSVKFKATGFYTQFKNGLDVLTFYDDNFKTFVNYALSNIGKEHYGAEVGIEAKLYKGLTLTGAASIGRYRYNTRQIATVTEDNNSVPLARDTVYSKNFNVATPQEAYSIGLEYRSRQYWFVNISFSYFNQLWLDFNPLRRTAGSVQDLDPTSDAYKQIVNQTQLPEQYTLDAFAGYSWLLNKSFPSMKHRTFLVFNLGVNNILNNKNIISGGFEQLRFDVKERDINKFPPKLFYAYGLNFFGSVSLRF